MENDNLFDPTSPYFRRDPYAAYARLRAHGPVYAHPAGVFRVVTGYESVCHVLKNPEIFSSAPMGGQVAGGNAEGRLVPGAGSLIGQDPPVHTDQRNIVSRGFTPRRIQALEPRIREIAEGCLADVRSGAGCDLTRDVANPVPVTVIAELLGLDPDRRDDFKRWSNLLVVGSTGGAQVSREERRRELDDFRDFILAHIEQVRRQPGDDLVSVLVHAEEEDGILSANQVFSFASLLLIAGAETTTNLIGNATIALLQHPEALARVRADRSLIPRVVEETLRWDSPVQLVYRQAQEDVELGSERIPRGSFVVVCLASANRDPAFFDDPDTFDIDRDTRGHLAFGLGHHFCLGSALARLEGRVVLETLLDRLPRFELESAEVRRHESFLVRGPASLPLRYLAA